MIAKKGIFTFLLFAFLLEALCSPLLVREVGNFHDADNITVGDVQAAPNRGWRVSGVADYKTASETWYIRKLIFYANDSCTSPLTFPLYDEMISRKVFSSHGNAKKAFDGSSWRIPSSHSSTDYTYWEDWHIGFYFTEEEFPPAVRCVEIYLENEDPKVTTTNMEIALEKLYQPDSYQSPQEHEWKLLYEVRGLESGSNVISFSETCVTSDVTLREWGDTHCDEEFNHATCLYDGGDCDRGSYSQIDEPHSLSTAAIIHLVATILIVLMFILICRFRFRTTQRNERPGESLHFSVQIALPISHSSGSINEIREVRRERILLSIIHKRVLSQQASKEKQSLIVSEDLSTNEQDPEKEKEGGKVKGIFPIILPHEESLSSRYQRVAPKPDEDAEEASISSNSDPIAMKNDIYLEKLCSIRENSSRIVVNNDVEDSLYSPKVCPICCEEYKTGDDIAWSKNESCHHAYHVDCIMEWLMEHEDCPLCREKYIEV